MIKLREYQQEAVSNFIQSDYKGIFEMATGTGKTITGLACIQVHYECNEQQFLVIVVPFLHLIDQWAKNLQLFGIGNYYEIAYSKKTWLPKLERLIWDYNNGYRKRVVLIGSYKSIIDKDFQRVIGKVKEGGFLLADECHYLGSGSIPTSTFSTFSARLGLSATPKRWWDEEGTEKVFSFFTDTIYEFPLGKAIEEGYLTNYYYRPVQVDLTLDEIDEYEYITRQIAVLFHKKNKTDIEKDKLEKLIIKRTKIIKNAENKLPLLLQLLRSQKEVRHTLVYCGEGQINKVTEAIAGEGINVHRFNSEIPNKKRGELLERFAEGNIQVLVAIKCLDEGVDIPSTKTAYFLASTSNPKEFIQRRGRILRKAPKKIFSQIYDFIVLPNFANEEIFRSIALKEMPRFAEFSAEAINNYESKQDITKILKRYHLEHLTEIKPWEMYQLTRKEVDNEYSEGHPR